MRVLLRVSFVGMLGLVGCRRAPEPAVSHRSEAPPAPVESAPPAEPTPTAAPPTTPDNAPAVANGNPTAPIVDAGADVPDAAPSDGSIRFVGNETLRAQITGASPPADPPHPGSLRILEAADGTHLRVFFVDSDRGSADCVVNAQRSGPRATTATIDSGQQCVSTQRGHDTLTLSIDNGTLSFGANGALTADYHGNLVMQSGTQTMTGSLTYHFVGTRQ